MDPECFVVLQLRLTLVMVSGAVPDTLKRRDASLGSSEKRGIGQYLPLFVNFTHENGRFPNKKGVCQLPVPSARESTENRLRLLLSLKPNSLA